MDKEDASDFIKETINNFRNGFFQGLSNCNGKQEKAKLIQYFISVSIKKMEEAQKINDHVETEIYSKFLKETLYLLKDFTLAIEKQPNVSEKSEVKPSAPPVIQDIPDSREDVKVVVDGTLEDWNLISFEEMMRILKYKDKRSFKKWCEENQVPIIELGKNKLIDRSFLEKIISTESEAKGHRAPIDNNVPKASSQKKEVYVPDNEIISKYLKKYESNCETSKKTST